ncbi:DUF6427 family protein [Rhodoflexus sp.]
MLSLFRINDPLRFLLAAAIFLLLRFGLFYGDLLPTGSEMLYRLVGERMAEGKKMYVDIWENIPPFSAGVFWLVHLLFGRSPLAYQIIGAALVILQAGILNAMSLRYNLYNEKNYLPALFYCLFALVSFDTPVLSPPLLAATPLLLLLDNLFRLRDRVDNEILFTIGAYVGAAILFYYPTIVFAGYVFLSAIFLRSLSPRQFVVILLGILFMPMLVVAYYYFVGGLEYFVRNYWLTLFFPERFLLNGSLLALLLVLPGLSFILAVSKVYANGMAFINFQQTTHGILLFWVLFVAVATFFIADGVSGSSLILLAAPYAFFISHYFLLLSKKWTTELMAILLIALLPAVGWIVLKKQPNLQPALRYSYTLAEQPLTLPQAAERILVLDNRWQYYHGRQLATPYLHPDLAAFHLQMLDRYAIAQAVYLNILSDMPDLIVCAPAATDNIRLFERLQILQRWYEQHPQYPDFYYKRIRTVQ